MAAQPAHDASVVSLICLPDGGLAIADCGLRIAVCGLVIGNLEFGFWILGFGIMFIVSLFIVHCNIPPVL